MNKRIFGMIGMAALLAAALGGCTSTIQPLRPVTRTEVWVPDETGAAAMPVDAAATEPAPGIVMGGATVGEAPATAPALAETPATQPGKMVVKVIDPNQTARFIYKASYDNIWQQGMRLLNKSGFALDRKDYRLGVLTTQPLPSAQVIEFWKPSHTNANDALENTLNNQRRSVRLTIATVPGKPDFYEIGIQVLVERETNPTEAIGGPVFVEGSGFGRNSLTLRSDFASPTTPAGRWVTLGHDPTLERKLLEALFQRL